jgi:hypothetical protein
VVFVIVCALPAALGGIGLYVGLRSYRLAGLIAATRVTAASAAQEGMTAIEGKSVGAFHRESAQSASDWLRLLLVSLQDRGVCSRRFEGVALDNRRGSDERVAVSHQWWERTVRGVACWRGASPDGSKRLAWRNQKAAGSQSFARISRKAFVVQGKRRCGGSPMLRFRYTEERIYPGDGIFALGWSSSDPPVASDSMEEPMGAIQDDPCGEIVDAKEETEAGRTWRGGRGMGSP